MELWIRSIARAGGVEMPASARVLEPRDARKSAGLRFSLARGLKRAGAYLLRAGDLLGGNARTAEGRC